MKKDTIEIENGRIEVLKDGNLIYMKVSGEYTDNDALAMTKYLEDFLPKSPGRQ
jgi:hypothetical protein